MIRCKELAKLLTSDQLWKQGLIRRAEVLLHLLRCRYCARFAKQIRQLKLAARQMMEATEAEQRIEGPENLETRLLRKLTDNRE